MKNFSRIGAAALATAALVFGPVVAAQATPWDGSTYIPFGPGNWELQSDSFGMDDVNAYDAATSYDQSTDLWDDAGILQISFDDWSSSTDLGAASDADLDITTDAATGDLLITAPMDDTDLTSNNLEIIGQMRIYAAGDLLRTTYQVKNVGTSPITVDLGLYTDFGSDGEIFDYQSQSDTVLAVPAAEDSTSQAALAGAGTQWAVHTESDDAPGAMAWGFAGASSPAVINEIDGDEWYAHVDNVTIAAGASATVAVFHNWTPDLLIADGYTNSDGNSAHQLAYATAATVKAAEFNSWSGRLTAGLEGVDVINWGPVAAATPELPNTGSDSATSLLVAGGAALMLLVGGAIFVMRRRANA